MPLLTAKDITKVYGEGAMAYRALSSVSLRIEAGTIKKKKKKSGSGKSTLLSILGGMEKPTKGQVYFRNQDFYQGKEEKQAEIRGKHFGFVFQAYYLIPELTVYDNIFMPLYINGATKKACNILPLAQQLDIADKLQAFPHQLSGGQQQRVSIARAMINQPEILFADEPTGNLDRKNSDTVMQILETLCKTNKQSLVIVTHDESLVKNPDQLFLLEDGRIIS